MISINKILLGMGLVVLLIALAKIGSAQMPGSYQEPVWVGPIEPDPGSARTADRAEKMEAGVPVEVLLSGQGFVFNNNQSHTLRINIERLLPLDPMSVRKLLADNKSLAEIKEAIASLPAQSTCRGFMRLDQTLYRLGNIRVTPPTNGSYILEADVARPGLDPLARRPGMAAGCLQVNIISSPDETKGSGMLILNDGMHAGQYSVLLDLMPPMRREKHEWERMN